MKAKASILSLTLLVGLIFMIGCATASKPPTALEQKFFTVQTNTVPVITYQTNTVTQTNMVFQTNAVGLVSSQPIVTQTPVVLITTNQTTQYSFAPNSTAATIQGIGGAAGGLFGVGGIVSTAIGGLFALYAGIRSKQSNKVSGVLAQGIELAKSVMANVPGQGGGDKLVQAFTDKLQKNQVIAGVVTDVAKIIDDHVDVDVADSHAATVVANASKS